jgi:hypothetical protein
MTNLILRNSLVLAFIWWDMRITPAVSGTVTETPGLCT